MLAILLVTAVVGVDYGWQPHTGGGFEYIIQIEPETLQSLKNGNDIVSDLPPYLRGVRSYRITVGTSEVPRLGTPPVAVTTENDQPTSSRPQASEPVTPHTFETVDDLAEGPPPEFMPRPVVEPGQWQPRQVTDEHAQPDATTSTDSVELPSEAETGPLEPPVPLEFPTVPSNDSPAHHRPPYEPPGSSEPPATPSYDLPGNDRPLFKSPAVESGAGATMDPPGEDSVLADQPPYLPDVPAGTEIPTARTSFEANVRDSRRTAKPPISGDTPSESSEATTTQPEEKSMWWPFVICLLGLCLSLGGNVYLGWLTVAFRGRYRHVARRLRAMAGGSSTERERESHLRWG